MLPHDVLAGTEADDMPQAVVGLRTVSGRTVSHWSPTVPRAASKVRIDALANMRWTTSPVHRAGVGRPLGGGGIHRGLRTRRSVLDRREGGDVAGSRRRPAGERGVGDESLLIVGCKVKATRLGDSDRHSLAGVEPACAEPESASPLPLGGCAGGEPSCHPGLVRVGVQARDCGWESAEVVDVVYRGDRYG